ncbi:single-stranded DNA-binding protein [Clostridium sp. HBUAS56017]|uniref:single-stranded DNA-binding protein n=1 Tax=Clostridium sp. HBUAS56017 TaxID=2571128 RepID=UPI001177B589|nr:single-stranded DNA-binding protein [Clostridium sp. HBUAS56017]
MNKVIILGRLTADPNLKFTAGTGTAVSRFTVAVNRPFKKEETDFINCVSFGKTAETISQYLTKGRQIAVIGNIRTGSYEAQDGSKRYTTDVAVDSFEFIGSKDVANNATTQNDAFSGGFGDDITPVEDPDGDMPF